MEEGGGRKSDATKPSPSLEPEWTSGDETAAWPTEWTEDKRSINQSNLMQGA